MDKVEVAVSKIKQQLQSHGDREIPSLEIGEWVMEQLRQLDQVGVCSLCFGLPFVRGRQGFPRRDRTSGERIAA